MSFKSVKAFTLAPTTSVEAKIDLTGINHLSQILIQPEGAPIRWTDDPNFTLSSSAGMLLADGDTMTFNGDWRNLRMIAASGTPTVWVYTYSGGI